MKKRLFITSIMFLLLGSIGLSNNLEALSNFNTDDTNEDISLTSAPHPKPTIFGIKFDNTPKQTIQLLTEEGLELLSQEAHGPYNLISVLTFKGIPKELILEEGTTRLLFFKNKLTRIDLAFNPNYRNFLIVREQLFQSMENQFRIISKHETMDRFLRSKLALLKKDEFNHNAEEAVKQSMLEGKTFFFYAIQDLNNELNISYSFSAAHQSTLQPQLLLHYSLKTRMEEMQAFHTERLRNPLPQKG